MWLRALADVGIRSASLLGNWAERIRGPRFRGRFGILLYHRIAAVVPGLPPPSINVTPGQFRKQLAGLLAKGFVFWPLSKVLDCVAQGQPVPPYVTVLTIDDGFAGTYLHAWPVLRELRIRATVFLATAYLDWNEPFPFDHWGRRHAAQAPAAAYLPLSSEQCREMLDSGAVEFGAHSHTHEDFRHRAADFRCDLLCNLHVLRNQFGLTEVPFAFPYGTPRLGFTAEDLVDSAMRTGVRCGLTTHSSLIDPRTSPFTWGRFTAQPWDTGRTLAAKLSGWYGWAPELKNRLLGRVSKHEPQALASGDGGANVGGARPAASAVGSPGQDAHINPLISVIVPTLNRATWLREGLQTLVEQETRGRFEFEIVVVDNNSTDNTDQVLAQLTGQSNVPIRYCRQPIPGDAPARNGGLPVARGQWLAFFDDDQLAEPNWLVELFEAARLAETKIVGGAVRLDLDERQLRELGRWCRAALRETDLYSELQPYTHGHLPGTGNALVARSVFEAVGDFDASFRDGGSDFDFFSRARAAGFTPWYTPRAVIRHRVDPQRLSPARLRRDAVSGGAETAGRIDYPQGGLTRLVVGCAGRLAQAALLHLPLLAIAWLQHDRGEVLGRLTRLWRTEGYFRRTAAIVARCRLPSRRIPALTFRPRHPGERVST